MGKFKLNRAGFRELRNRDAMVSDLDRRAKRIAQKAGPGYEATSQKGKTRARASVRTATFDAMRDNSKNNTLIRAKEAGRD